MATLKKCWPLPLAGVFKVSDVANCESEAVAAVAVGHRVGHFDDFH